jgi:hypothetical protein
LIETAIALRRPWWGQRDTLLIKIPQNAPKGNVQEAFAGGDFRMAVCAENRAVPALRRHSPEGSAGQVKYKTARFQRKPADELEYPSKSCG